MYVFLCLLEKNMSTNRDPNLRSDTIKQTSTTASSRSKSIPDMSLECMEIMNGMNFPDTIYGLALKIFVEEPAKANMFFHLPKHRRNNWLGVLLDHLVDHPLASASFPLGTNENMFNVVPPANPFGHQSSNSMFDILPPPPGPFF